MARIILIETSTALCSTALADNGKIIAYRENSERAHASLTAPFVKEMLDECGLTVGDCDAVCVGKGPGSYTGLRVGVSTAKGLCFGAGLPMMAMGSLDILVAQAKLENLLPEGCRYVVPMIDARRMEVYSAVYSVDGEKLTEVAPVIVEEGSFSKELAEGVVLFIGDGAAKCEAVLNSANARFVSACPKASSMAGYANEAYRQSRFEDVAYFEPFYLKEFVATVSKKKLF